MTTVQKEHIYQMREEGLSYSTISSLLQISENTVKSHCRRNNLCSGFNASKNQGNEEFNNIHQCRQCGKYLDKGTRGQPKRFCAEECRRLWWKTHEKQLNKKAWYSLVCCGCGNKFVSYGNQSRKFCSHACYIKKRFEKMEDCSDTGAIQA